MSHPNGDVIEYRYDAQGNRTRLITPHGTTRYTFDALNRIHTVSSPDNETTTYFYDQAGNEIRQEQSGGIHTEKTYDNLNRLTGVVNHAADDSIVSSYAYTLNDLGMRTSVVEADGSRVDYAYNAINQLVSESRTGSHAYSISYVYDRVGNRLSMIRDGVETTYSYNSRSQLVSEINAAGGINYAYDEAGRMISKADQSGTTTFTWVDDDRLASVTGPGVNVAYEYDFEGKRVLREADGDIRKYLIDTRLPFGQVIAETGSSDQLIAEYVYGLDRISRKADGEVLNYLSDAQGSIRQLADTSGNITDSYGYLAYGESLWDTGSTENEFRFVGEQTDPATNAIYLRARWYQPQMGRFISSDIIQGDYQRPLTLNRYEYCSQNPVNYLDPRGTLDWSILNWVKLKLGMRVDDSTDSKKGMRYCVGYGHGIVGYCSYTSGGEFGGGGALTCDLHETYCNKKKVYRADYIAFFGGLTFGAPVGKTWFSLNFEKTNDVRNLRGFASIATAGSATGGGASWGKICLGSGCAYGWNAQIGIDLSADIFGGYGWVYNRTWEPCQRGD